MEPLASDLIMLARSIWSFRHLEHQNPSINSDSKGRARMVQKLWRRNRSEKEEWEEYSCLRGCNDISLWHVTINISIIYGSEWMTLCCSYNSCHKMITKGQILEFEVSIEPY